MNRQFEQIFSNLKPPEPPLGLFDRIIMAIKKEQELRHTKRLLIGFLLLLVVSFAGMPFSWMIFKNQIETSGIPYFISAAAGNINVFLSLWQDFILAILESLPITGIILFAFNLALVVWTLRLFLYKKRLLFGYLLN